jgi:hypothetical protein
MDITHLPLIPRKLLFDNPERTQARLSPSGAYLSWLAPKDGVLNVWVAQRENLHAAQALTQDTGRGIRLHEHPLKAGHLVVSIA